MDIFDKTNLFAVLGWCRKASAKSALNKRERELIDLLYVLLVECTPYLGGHSAVEKALAKFKESMIP